MKRLAATMSAVVAVLAGAGATAHAQTDAYPPRSLTVTQDADEVAPGATFSVVLTGCLGGEIVDFVFGGERRSLECDLTAGPRGLLAAEHPVGGATSQLVAPASPGRFVGSVIVAGQPVGDFGVTVVDAAIEVVNASELVESATDDTPLSSDSGGLNPFLALLVGVGMLGAGLTVAKVAQR